MPASCTHTKSVPLQDLNSNTDSPQTEAPPSQFDPSTNHNGRPTTTTDESASQNVAFEHSDTHETADSGVSKKQWLNASRRKNTLLRPEHIEERVFAHVHIFHRPDPHQYFNPSLGHQDPNKVEKTRRNSTGSGSSHDDIEERSTDDIARQLRRVDLFVDLIWVGIIANLSATYGEHAFSPGNLNPGQAFGEFILLFIPIWRTWDYLRDYCMGFYKDDFLQRIFIVWILVLSVLYGFNAPYAIPHEGEYNSLVLLIGDYLVIRLSFLVIGGLQVIYVPFLRVQYLFTVIMTLITSALWIGAIFAPWDGGAKVALFIIAHTLEQPIAMAFESPLGNRLVRNGWVGSRNVDHYRERHEEFFIIILGEGVFRLIEGSPSGPGLNSRTGTVLTALLMYYQLHWLYFNGDQSKKFIHALRRTWWKPVLWKAYHISLFAALLVLASAVLFLVKTDSESPVAPAPESSGMAILSRFSFGPSLIRREEPDTANSEDQASVIIAAFWSASIALACILIDITMIALLNRSLDKPGTLVVDSRLLRLSMRVPAIVVICCLPLIKGLTGAGFIAGAFITLYACFLWEWTVGLEKGWKWFEKRDAWKKFGNGSRDVEGDQAAQNENARVATEAENHQRDAAES